MCVLDTITSGVTNPEVGFACEVALELPVVWGARKCFKRPCRRTKTKLLNYRLFLIGDGDAIDI